MLSSQSGFLFKTTFNFMLFTVTSNVTWGCKHHILNYFYISYKIQKKGRILIVVHFLTLDHSFHFYSSEALQDEAFN